MLRDPFLHRMILLAGLFAAGVLCARDAGAAKPYLTIGANGMISGAVRDLALSSDGRWLAAGGDTQVRVWDLHTGRLYATLRGFQLPPGLKLGRVNSVAFSANARQLVVGVSDNTDSGSMRIYDLDRPEEIASLLEGHTACSDRVAFSADFNYLASFG